MTKQISSHAAAAKAIRQELKKHFPTTKFSVKSESFSMGDAVRIDWTDGATHEQVDSIARKYQYGSFDGMTDSYEYSNSRQDIPQTKYVQLQRNTSDKFVNEALEYCKTRYTIFSIVEDLDQTYPELNKQLGTWTARNFIYRLLRQLDLTNGFNPKMIKNS